MSKVRNGVSHHKRVKKVLKLAKGFRGRRKNCYRVAKNAVMLSLEYAYRDRRQKKREFRRLWITRINAALIPHSLSYSKFMFQLKKNNIGLDRKVLSNMAIEAPEAFNKLVHLVQENA